MSFFPEGFDPRADIVGLIDLVSIDAPSGLARFMVGQDGVFTDADGNRWIGSSLITASPPELSRDGTAPAGQLTLSYFQDPEGADLISALRASGDTAIRGAVIRHYVQPLTDVSQFYAPVHAPVLVATKTAGTLRTEIVGDLQRSLSVDVEGPTAMRRAARGLNYTVDDHARLTGAPNPSLELMPQTSMTEEKLFG